MRDEDLSLPEDIQRTEEQLHLYDGLVAAFDDPIAMLEVLLSAEDVDDARLGLGKRFGLDHIQATAVLDAQCRCVTELDRTRVRAQSENLSVQLNYLRGLGGLVSRHNSQWKTHAQRGRSGCCGARYLRQIRARPRAL